MLLGQVGSAAVVMVVDPSLAVALPSFPFDLIDRIEEI
jgi:hypothetical protein